MNAQTRELTLRVDAARRERISGHEARLEKHSNHRNYKATSNLGKRYKPQAVCIQRRYNSYRITVPPILAEQLPSASYVCELVDEGILYRRVESEAA